LATAWQVRQDWEILAKVGGRCSETAAARQGDPSLPAELLEGILGRLQARQKARLKFPLDTPARTIYISINPSIKLINSQNERTRDGREGGSPPIEMP
jgi:hypothetical protein